MLIDLDEGDEVQGAEVTRRYRSGLGAESAKVVLDDPNKEDLIIKAMKRMGWTYHFTRDETNAMVFRDADNWDMEPGAGNS